MQSKPVFTVFALLSLSFACATRSYNGEASAVETPTQSFAGWSSRAIELAPRNCIPQRREVVYQNTSHFSLYNLYLGALFGKQDLSWDDDKVRGQLKKFGFTDVELIKDNDGTWWRDYTGKGLDGFVASRPDATYIHFRGTHDIAGIMTDLDLRPKDGSVLGLQGKLHAGFLSGYLSIHERLLGLVKKTTPPGKPIFLSGHSYGGALSVIAATILRKQGMNVQAVYTTGQPRVGDDVFAADVLKTLEGRYYRTINNLDPVPHVPPPPVAAEPFLKALSPLGLLAGMEKRYLGNQDPLVILKQSHYTHSDVPVVQLHADSGISYRRGNDDFVDEQYWQRAWDQKLWHFNALNHFADQYLCYLSKEIDSAK